jgi:hypothetical protein
MMNHNHRRLPMWRNRHMNRATDYWFSTFQGHPGFVLNLFHNNNHHRHCNGAADYTRVYRHRDNNNALGFLVHPFKSTVTLVPIVRGFLRDRHKQAPRIYRAIRNEYLYIAGCVTGGLIIDWRNALIYIVIPQLFALFWVLGANYLLHTPHHLDGKAHWSELTSIHCQIRHRIDPKLIDRVCSGTLCQYLCCPSLS